MREIIFYRLKSGKSPIEKFLDSLTDKQFEKTAYVFDLIESQAFVSTEYFKKLKGTQNIWEVRIQQGNNIFRFLGFLDGNQLVVLNHGFIKKTQKTPRNEIKIAEKRKKEYETMKGNNE